MGETVVFFENDHHRKLANYDVLRYDIIKKISLMDTGTVVGKIERDLRCETAFDPDHQSTVTVTAVWQLAPRGDIRSILCPRVLFL